MEMGRAGTRLLLRGGGAEDVVEGEGLRRPAGAQPRPTPLSPRIRMIKKMKL
jgi:hypothetical protein